MQPAGAEQTPFKPREEGTSSGNQQTTRAAAALASIFMLVVRRMQPDAGRWMRADSTRLWIGKTSCRSSMSSRYPAWVVTILSQVDTYFDNGFIGSWFEFRFTHNLLLVFLAIKMSLKPRHHPSINQSGYLLRSNLLYFQVPQEKKSAVSDN